MPTRSASDSLSRVKLICCCAAMPWAAAMPPSTAWPPPAAPEEDRRQHRGRGGQCLLALRAQLAGDVVLRDVRDFVRHHARELRLAGGGENQSLVDEDEAAGHGEGVDAVESLMTKNWKSWPAVGALRGQALADGLDVLAHLRVLEQRVLIAQLAASTMAPRRYSSGARDVGGRGLPMSGRSEPAGGALEHDRLGRVGLIVREGDGRDGQQRGREQDREDGAWCG